MAPVRRTAAWTTDLGSRGTRPWIAASLALCAALLPGCATVLGATERAAIGFSLLRSPITLQTPEVNSCMEAAQRVSLDAVAEAVARSETRRQAVEENFVTEIARPRCRRILLQHANVDRVDDHSDLVDSETIVVVAISGGGSRAARLGAHTLAQLEDLYNEYASTHAGGELRPLACLVAAFSTVSGGSIYVSYVASRFAAGSDDVGRGCTDPSRAEAVRSVFRDVRDSGTARIGQRDLGTVAAAAYLSPITFFLLPSMTLLTDRSFLDVLAHAVNLTHGRYFAETMLGELPQRPRFFFNSVVVETGAPFVLTQRVQHLPSLHRPSWTARVDLPHGELRDPARPLISSLTLEELNASSALFPLAYAALASAAFPPVMEPLELRYYGLDADAHEMVATKRSLHLTDGGVFDNSGLITAVDLFEHLVYEARLRRGDARPTRRLVLLAINAETTSAPSHRPSLTLDPAGAWGAELWWPVRWLGVWGFGLNWPARHLGAQAFDQIHYTNKRRGEEIAWEHLAALEKEMEGAVDVEVLYFPVNLTQLSGLDRFAIEGAEETFERVREIPTDYTIRADHDRLLADAVTQILDADQGNAGRRPEAGWTVGPEGGRYYRLGEAFVQAMVLAQRGAEPPGR
jgi:hypothetical protein